MTENKMYPQRVKNIPVMRYCGFGCVYCAFQKFQKISSCQKCRAGENHSHLEVLQRTPPKTKDGEFLTVGLSGDVSFMPLDDFAQVLNYCWIWSDRTFLIQSKTPAYFVQAIEELTDKCWKGSLIPDNVILGATMETNRGYIVVNPRHPKEIRCNYQDFSHATFPQKRYEAMLKLTCNKEVTIEPIMDFDLEVMAKWIKDIAPEFVYIGYCNDGKQGKRLKLPEPPLAKTLELIARLREAGIDVREKTIRKSWWEQ